MSDLGRASRMLRTAGAAVATFILINLAGELGRGPFEICDLRTEVVRADKKHCWPGDAPRARELAGIMIRVFSLAMTPKARTAYDHHVRAW